MAIHLWTKPIKFQEMRDSITFFRSYFDSARMMSDADRLAFYDAVLGYALYDIEPVLGGSPALVFTAIQPILDESAKWQDTKKARAEGGKSGGRPRKENQEENLNKNLSENLNKNHSKNPNSISISKGIGNSIGKEKNSVVANAPISQNRFIKPSIEDIAAYAATMGYGNFEAEAFYDFYQSKDWKVGSNPMKDWKAAVRNWQRRRQGDMQPKLNFGKSYDDLHPIGDFTNERNRIHIR